MHVATRRALLNIIPKPAGSQKNVACRSATSKPWTNERWTFTLDKPTGTAEGDILLAGFSTDTANFAAPDGWTKIVSTAHPVIWYMFCYVYWKRAGASEPNDYTWANNINWATGCILAISGAATSGDPQDADYATDAGSSSVNVSIPSVTTRTDGSLAVALFITSDEFSTSTPPDGWTEYVDDRGIYAIGKTQASAGATGATTATLSVADSTISVVVAL